MRINAVVFRFGHFFHAADLNRLTIHAQYRADDASLVVGGHVHIRRIEPVFFAVALLAVIGFVQYHALREQVFERLVELNQTQIAHDFRPETRVQQVQNRVFNPADVLIHRHPVIIARVHHFVGAVWAGIAHVVPA